MNYDVVNSATLEIPKNSIYIIPLTFTYNADGTAYDLTGCTIYFVVKADPTDAIADAIISYSWSSHTSPTAGETTMTLPASTAASGTNKTLGRYYYNLNVRKSGVNMATYMGVAKIIPNPANDA